jgi:hypothetical protein
MAVFLGHARVGKKVSSGPYCIVGCANIETRDFMPGVLVFQSEKGNMKLEVIILQENLGF